MPNSKKRLILLSVFQKQSPAVQQNPVSEFMDLSFSTSFGGEDIISAVDKLEKDYGETVSTKLNTKLNENHHLQNKNENYRKSNEVTKRLDNGKHSVHDAHAAGNFSNKFGLKDSEKTSNTVLNTISTDVKIKDAKTVNKDNKTVAVSVLVTEKPAKVRACQLRTESKENIKSTPPLKSSHRKSRISISSSFLLSPDISFTSPQGISTPQETPTRGTKAKHKNKTSTTDKSTLSKANKTVRGKHKNEKLPVTGKDKTVDNTPVRSKDAVQNNKSDFFKSLFMDKSSDISISPTGGQKILVDKSPDLAAEYSGMEKDNSSKSSDNNIGDDLSSKEKEIEDLNKENPKRTTVTDISGVSDERAVLAEDSTDNIGVEPIKSAYKNDKTEHGMDTDEVGVAVEDEKSGSPKFSVGENGRVVHSKKTQTVVF